MAARSRSRARPRSAARHAGRGARPVLRHARAAEIPEVRARRGRGRARRGAAPRHGPPASPSRSPARSARRSTSPPRCRRRRPARAARRRPRRATSAPMPLPSHAEREGVAPDGLRRPADATSRATSLAQYLFVNGRPVRDKLLLGARARRLCRLSAARPPSAAGAVRRRRSARGRRQRASGQDRSALPRCRRWCAA